MTADRLGTIDLLPCPFCGGKPDENAIEAHTHSPLLKSFGIPDHKGSHVIECGCGAGLIDETRAAVVAHWNMRAKAAALTPAAGDVSWPGRIDSDTPALALSRFVDGYLRGQPQATVSAQDLMGALCAYVIGHPAFAAPAPPPAATDRIESALRQFSADMTTEAFTAILAAINDTEALSAAPAGEAQPDHEAMAWLAAQPKLEAPGAAADLIGELQALDNTRQAIGGTPDLAALYRDRCATFLHRNHGALLAALAAAAVVTHALDATDLVTHEPAAAPTPEEREATRYRDFMASLSEAPRAAAQADAEAAFWTLRQILADLPKSRDWLDPDVEKVARGIVARHPHSDLTQQEGGRHG